MLSGRGLCDELITRPEESYRLWRVVVCDLETSSIGAPYIYIYIHIYIYIYMGFNSAFKGLNSSKLSFIIATVDNEAEFLLFIVHVLMIISFIPTHAHFLHTLKTLIHINT